MLPGHWLALLCFAAALHQSYGALFNPCLTPSPVARGDPFVVGVVFIPRVNASALANVSALYSDGFCSPVLQQELVSKWGARVAVYQLRVDRLTVLKIPYPDIVLNMVNATPPTMAVAVFRANYTSKAVYIASGDADITYGGGFVVSVALLLRFEKGNLKYLQWYDQTCNECQGKSSRICFHNTQAAIYSCSTPLTNCSCSAWDPTKNNGSTTCSLASSQFDICATSINVAWLGEDKNQAAFRTGPQIQRLNAYSIVSLFNKARDKFFVLYNYTTAAIKENWGSINGDVNSQYVDFNGGFSAQAIAATTPVVRSPPPPSPSPPSAG